MAIRTSLYKKFFAQHTILTNCYISGKNVYCHSIHMRKSAVSLSVWQLIRGRILKIVVSCCCNNCNWEGARRSAVLLGGRRYSGIPATSRGTLSFHQFRCHFPTKVMKGNNLVIQSSNIFGKLSQWLNSLTTYWYLSQCGGDRVIGIMLW